MNEDNVIMLREGELTALIRASSRDRLVEAFYGPGFVAIEWKKSKWALPILAEMRGVDLEFLPGT